MRVWADNNLDQVKAWRRLVSPELKQRAGQFYSLSADGRQITCHVCGSTSSNPVDVQRKHCPCCRTFHEDHSLMVRLDEGYRAALAATPVYPRLRAA